MLLGLGAALQVGCGREAQPADDDRASRRQAADDARRREEVTSRVRATLREEVHFSFDGTAIRPDAERILRAKLGLLRADSTIRLRIEGHADERGTEEYNLQLGLRRAQAVRRFLTRSGVPAERLETDTFGETRPVDRGHGERAWAANRRAGFWIISGPGRAGN